MSPAEAWELGPDAARWRPDGRGPEAQLVVTWGEVAVRIWAEVRPILQSIEQTLRDVQALDPGTRDDYVLVNGPTGQADR